MPLEKCPWMAARCPHYVPPCKEPGSQDCFYVKETTQAVTFRLQQLKVMTLQPGLPDSKLHSQIADLQQFLDASTRR